MKKSSSILLLFIGLLLFVGIAYLIFKVYTIFGFWNIVGTGFIQFVSGIYLFQWIGSRVEKNNEIIFNPKEWPKFFNFLLSLAIAYYLVDIIRAKNLSQSEFVFGILYIGILSVLPTIRAIYRLIRDRNDYISISEKSIKYRDNDDSGEYEFEKIKSVELSLEGIKLELTTGAFGLIKIANMNFNSRDTYAAVTEIKARIPEKNKTNLENSSEDDTETKE